MRSLLSCRSSCRFSSLPCLLAILLGVVAAATGSASAVSTSVVISEFRFRGPGGASDEFVELYNLSGAAVDISGWKLNGSNSSGTTGTRATVPNLTTLQPGCHYLFTNSTATTGYSGTVAGNTTFTTGFTDDGGVAILNSSGVIVDQVGLSAGSAYKEGTILASLGSTNNDRSYERKLGGTSGNSTDTDDNSADFVLRTPSNPQNLSTGCLAVVTVTSPNGGESWAAGSTHSITWTSINKFATADILLSDDNGTSFATTIATGVSTATSSYSWTVPASLGSNFRVRVRASGGSASDDSDGSFTIAPPPVDCVVSDWTAWGACSVPCGGGTQTRTRTIVTPAANGGQECPVLVETQSCNTQPCPVDCVVSDWSAWGACSVPCGGGTQTRTRTILTPAANGGQECPVLVETQSCNTQPCPVDCTVSPWSAWGACSVPCGGGTQTRTRTILTPAANGGAPCPELIETQACNTQPCPVDCTVSAWSAWSPCSVPCGGGTQTRTRTIITPAANGGQPCPTLIETQPCNMQPCPVDCVVSAWSDWSACSVSCGGGTQTRTRTVVSPAANGGQPCPILIETQACNTQPCPVDCVVSAWSAWGACSVPCGGGTQTRTRTIVTPASNGGQPCPILVETQACNTQACTGVNCVVSDWSDWSTCSAPCGGGTQIRTRTILVPAGSDGQPCPALVETRACNSQVCLIACCATDNSCTFVTTAACAGTARPYGDTCTPNPCTIALGACCDVIRGCSVLSEAACGSASSWTTGVTCTPYPCSQPIHTRVARSGGTTPRPLDCIVGPWSAWSDCNAACGGGVQTRTRVLILPAANGGAACPPLVETRPCNTQPCSVDCVVSDWSAWGSCSKSCGGGTQVRTRTVLVPAANGGQTCPTLIETQPCNTQPCPVDCVVSAWSAWSPCSVPCGGGTQTRTRTIVTPAAFGGQPCPILVEMQPCNTQPCPVDCVVSDWSAWGACSKSCGGGTQTRTRTIVTPAANGGQPCPVLVETQPCNTQPCPVDCVVSAWSAWSPCSVPCGGGTQTRTRTIVTPAAFGGQPCPILVEMQPCNTQPCPVDCVVSPWSAWSACSAPCGGGTQTRTRTIVTPAANGGFPCPTLIETQPCNMQPCPVDCVVSDWSPWGECSVSCGGGTQVRTRTVIVPAANGGQSCPILVESQPCNTQPCP